MSLKRDNVGIRVENKRLKHIALLANDLQGYSNLIHNEMRRAKLAPASLPPGALPSTSWYEVPRCFVCDEAIKSHRLSTSLLAGRTQFSHSALPSKIGEYIGDEFVVVVTAQDALCKHCMALINTMDRLEHELRQHRNTLTQHLKTKYGLDGKSAKQAKRLKVDDEDEDDPVVIELSDEEWTPNKKQRTEVMKQHRCTICNAIFTNLSHFMAHLSRHKQLEKPKPKPAASFTPSTTAAPVSATTVSATSAFTGAARLHLEQIAQSMFKCGCCTESFTSKEKLADHMRMHTVSQSKTTSNQSQTVVEMKLVAETEATIASESSLQSQATALFEDLEQLPQPEIPPPPPPSTGVCTEEQKGKVCLLALLNNGVCSDLSHRSPVDNPPAASVMVSLNSDVHGFSNLNDQPTISVTVSVPSDVSAQLGIGGNAPQCMPMISQQQIPLTLSLPSSVQHYQSVNASSVPPISEVTKAIVVTIPDQSASQRVIPSSSKSFTKSLGLNIKKTEAGKQFEMNSQIKTVQHNFGINNSLDMPNLLGNSSPQLKPGPAVRLTENISTSSNAGSSSSQNISNQMDDGRLGLSSVLNKGNSDLENSCVSNVSIKGTKVEGISSSRNPAVIKGSSGDVFRKEGTTSQVLSNLEKSCVQDMPDLGCNNTQNMPDLGCDTSVQNSNNLKSNSLQDVRVGNSNLEHAPNLPEITNVENSVSQDVPNVSSCSMMKGDMSADDRTRAQDMPDLGATSLKECDVKTCNSLYLPDLFGAVDVEPLNREDKDSPRDCPKKDESPIEAGTPQNDCQEAPDESRLQDVKSETETTSGTNSSLSMEIKESLPSEIISTTSNTPNECVSIPASKDQNDQKSVENIAIVSVTSVQVSSGDNSNAEHLADEWFYSNSDKPDGAKTSESDLIFEQSWLQETKDPSSSGAS